MIATFGFTHVGANLADAPGVYILQARSRWCQGRFMQLLVYAYLGHVGSLLVLRLMKPIKSLGGPSKDFEGCQICRQHRVSLTHRSLCLTYKNSRASTQTHAIAARLGLSEHPCLAEHVYSLPTQSMSVRHSRSRQSCALTQHLHPIYLAYGCMQKLCKPRQAACLSQSL